MARTGIVFGLLLCGLTVVGLVGTSVKYPTQFIPMMLGIPVLFCGVVALNPHRRKHAMQAASAVALLGAVAGATRVAYCLVELAGGAEINRNAFQLVIATSVICAVFVVICVFFFIQTRRRKAAGLGAGPGHSIHIHPPAAKGVPLPDANSRESA